MANSRREEQRKHVLPSEFGAGNRHWHGDQEKWLASVLKRGAERPESAGTRQCCIWLGYPGLDKVPKLPTPHAEQTGTPSREAAA